MKNPENSILQVEKQNAIKIYEEQNESGKLLLQRIFGKAAFKAKGKGGIENINSMEDVRLYHGIEPQESIIKIQVPECLDRHMQAIIMYAEALLIAEAINDGWIPDWNNSNQPKFSPWFEMRDTPGFGFSGTHCFFTFTLTGTGSRLCFQTETKTKHFGMKFHEHNKAIMTLKKES
jgi:hypothetical protein